MLSCFTSFNDKRIGSYFEFFDYSTQKVLKGTIRAIQKNQYGAVRFLLRESSSFYHITPYLYSILDE